MIDALSGVKRATEAVFVTRKYDDEIVGFAIGIVMLAVVAALAVGAFNIKSVSAFSPQLREAIADCVSLGDDAPQPACAKITMALAGAETALHPRRLQSMKEDILRVEQALDER